MFCYIQNQNVTLIDSEKFFIDYIQKDIINTCYEHNIIKKDKINLSNKDVKKIFFHYIIARCCYYAINSNSPCIFCLNSSSLSDCEITSYIDKDKLKIFFNKVLKQISKIIPLCITECSCNIEQICADIAANKGEALDFITTLKRKINKNKTSNFTLQKAKKFVKIYELNFIDKEFLNKLSIKAKILS